MRGQNTGQVQFGQKRKQGMIANCFICEFANISMITGPVCLRVWCDIVTLLLSDCGRQIKATSAEMKMNIGMFLGTCTDNCVACG